MTTRTLAARDIVRSHFHINKAPLDCVVIHYYKTGKYQAVELSRVEYEQPNYVFQYVVTVVNVDPGTMETIWNKNLGRKFKHYDTALRYIVNLKRRYALRSALCDQCKVNPPIGYCECHRALCGSCGIENEAGYVYCDTCNISSTPIDVEGDIERSRAVEYGYTND